MGIAILTVIPEGLPAQDTALIPNYFHNKVRDERNWFLEQK